MWAELAVTAIKLVVAGVALLSSVVVMVWVERRGAAFIQDRLGPNRVGPLGLAQPVIDAIKLFFKEDVTPASVNRGLYFLAPMISMFVALATFIVIPFGGGHDVKLFGVPFGGFMVASNLNVGILFLLAIGSLGVYGIVLAGWSSNNKYSLLGGLRSSAQLISYELSMTLAVLGVLLATGSLHLGDVVSHQAGALWRWNAVPQAIGFVTFVIAVFAETNRLPFDLAEAETELVAGYHVEYSSMKFAAFFMSEYMNMVTAAALIVSCSSAAGRCSCTSAVARSRASVRVPGQGRLLPVAVRLGALVAPPLPLRPADGVGLEGTAAASHPEHRLGGRRDDAGVAVMKVDSRQSTVESSPTHPRALLGSEIRLSTVNCELSTSDRGW
jgi:NADH-quinone oxidoreductase subunit H